MSKDRSLWRLWQRLALFRSYSSRERETVVTCPGLSEILNVIVVARVPAHGHAYRVNPHQDTEAGVLRYVVGCLATGMGSDEARDVGPMAMVSAGNRNLKGER